MVQSTGTSPQGADPIESPRPVQPGPESPPPVAGARRGRGRLRKWWARFVVLVLLAAAVLLFLRISTGRATEANRIDLGNVTLSAQSIPVEVPQTGLVTAVSVTAQQRVIADQKLGTLEVTSTDSQGDPKITKMSLTAPRAGIVVDLPATVGSTLQPGQPFLELYDPTQLTFESDVPLEDLPEIAPTMIATLKAESLVHTVRARVQRIVPRVGDFDAAPSRNPNKLRVVLVPAGAQEVRGLVPGMRFTGYVDTSTGVPGTPRLVSMGRP
ncbi:HlyD family efflux transporter periplasmic adaptor subunit [Actinoplanes sp. NPDC049668]|uniref:HlyD family efflux transporter periplasmic adaptor subunit n=1 Tax=unclassified Actinoplanes TaxID=2626549 RepID=UPI00339E7366